MADQGTGPQAAGWWRDPSGRHYRRYWDGHRWAQHVISAEKVESLDPLAPRREPSVEAEVPVKMPAVRRVSIFGGGAPRPGPARSTKPGKVLMAEPRIEPATATTGGVWEFIHGPPRRARWTLAVVTVVVISAATVGNDDKKTVDAGREAAATQATPSLVQVTPSPTAPPVTVKPSVDAQLAAFAQAFGSFRDGLADAIKKENPVSVASVDRFEFDLEGPTVVLSVTSGYITAQQDGAWAVTKTMQQLWEPRTIADVPDVIPHFRLTLGAVRYECSKEFMMRLASHRASREDWEAACRV